MCDVFYEWCILRFCGQIQRLYESTILFNLQRVLFIIENLLWIHQHTHSIYAICCWCAQILTQYMCVCVRVCVCAWPCIAIYRDWVYRVRVFIVNTSTHSLSISSMLLMRSDAHSMYVRVRVCVCVWPYIAIYMEWLYRVRECTEFVYCSQYVVDALRYSLNVCACARVCVCVTLYCYI